MPSRPRSSFELLGSEFSRDGDIDELARRRNVRRVVEHAHRAGLLHHVPARGVARLLQHGDGLREIRQVGKHRAARRATRCCSADRPRGRWCSTGRPSRPTDRRRCRRWWRWPRRRPRTRWAGVAASTATHRVAVRGGGGEAGVGVVSGRAPWRRRGAAVAEYAITADAARRPSTRSSSRAICVADCAVAVTPCGHGGRRGVERVAVDGGRRSGRAAVATAAAAREQSRPAPGRPGRRRAGAHVAHARDLQLPRTCAARGLLAAQHSR